MMSNGCTHTSCTETFLYRHFPFCEPCFRMLMDLKRQSDGYEIQHKAIKLKYRRFQRAILGYTEAEKKYDCMPTTEEARKNIQQKNMHFLEEEDEEVDLDHLKVQTEILYSLYKVTIQKMKDEFNYPTPNFASTT